MEKTTGKTPTSQSHYLWIAAIAVVIIVAAYLQNQGQAEINSLQDALTDSKAQQRALLSQMEDSQSRLVALESSLADSQTSLQHSVEELRLALDDSQKQLAANTLLLNDRENSLVAQRARADQLATELGQAQDQLATQRSLYDKLTQQYQSQLERLAELSKSHQSIEAQYINAREQIALQQSESADYSATIEELQEALAAENAAMEELNSLLNELSESNQALVQKLENGSTMIALPERILFQSGSAQINRQGQATLSLLVQALKSFPNHIISVQGHSDSRPLSQTLKATYPSNWELSAARAAAAVRILLDQGIDSSRLQAVGFADSRPLVKEVNDASRAQNRRIEILLVPQLTLKRQPE